MSFLRRSDSGKIYLQTIGDKLEKKQHSLTQKEASKLIEELVTGRSAPICNKSKPQN